MKPVPILHSAAQWGNECFSFFKECEGFNHIENRAVAFNDISLLWNFDG